MDWLEQLKQALRKFETWVQHKQSMEPNHPNRAEELYEAAFSSIGRDVSPQDIAPDEYGCAESLSNVIRKVYPDFPICISTIVLNQKLSISPHFVSSANPISGCVSIFPTDGDKVGHAGVWGKKGWVMSNDSNTGNWLANYTEFGWGEAAKKRGLRVYYYIPI